MSLGETMLLQDITNYAKYKFPNLKEEKLSYKNN